MSARQSQAADPLKEYNKKRDFKKTAEPAGKRAAVHGEGGRFIVVRGPDRVNEVMEMTGVAQHIELVDEPPAA